jgi:ABC-type uncharacterized transport system auxiliary subunit
MKHYYKVILAISYLVILFSQSGCFWGKNERIATRYYVLDYLKSTENPALRQAKPFEKSLEIMDTKLPRTYDRNQLVKKTSYASITYFNNDLWANRLYDAVPNIIAQRLNAYNIFQKCGRDLGDATPEYFLETNIQNIEYVETDNPQAFLRIEFFLRNSADQTVIFSQVNERSQEMRDTSVDYLVQTYNQMIMYETDLFAGRCIDFLSGKPIRETYKVADIINKYYDNSVKTPLDSLESEYINSGELLVPLKIQSEVLIPYTVTRIDTLSDEEGYTRTGIMNEPMTLKPGNYTVSLSNDQSVSANAVILSKMRTVLSPTWGELLVRILDQSQNRVRMQYDLYYKTAGSETYDEPLGSRFSPSDEIGETDYVWILKPGNYMVTLQGASPASLNNFSTVAIEPGKSPVLTVIVDPQGGQNVMIGAGLLESSSLLAHKPFHKGAVHANVNFSSDNQLSEAKPVNSINLSALFDNKLEYDKWPLHLVDKSLYELGFNKTTDSDFKVNVDDYSLKNSLALYPWKVNKTLKNFGVYGRADVNTNFFQNFAYYPSDTNFMRISEALDTLYFYNARKLKVSDPPYPVSLREGTGLTYRWTISPSISMNFRSGYGWRQDYQKEVFSYKGEVTVNDTTYKVFEENPTTTSRGFESTAIFSALNLLDFISINSTFDVLFPRRNGKVETQYYNENLINIRLYRNISLDLRAEAEYDKAKADYILTKYNAFLRISMYY